MVALAANRSDIQKLTGSSKGGPLKGEMAAALHVFFGAMVMKDSAGFLRPAAALVTNRGVCGVATQDVNNTGAAGALECLFERGIYLMKCTGATQAWEGQLCYATDDQTVQLTTANNPAVGEVERFVSATSVWVAVFGENVL